ncbi:MAG: mechanosensitive ion channel family protein [Peptococcaceae bacterium]|nr:mechanosensitive ion channel family protein [Peptococcaceae bacterium]
MKTLIQLITQVDYITYGRYVLNIAVILAVSWAALRLSSKLIRNVFEKVARMPHNKKETLVTLLMSLTKYIIWIFAVLMIISLFTPLQNLAPLLAGASVVGLAVGFGAQSFIKDVITGFFIQFEDQLHVGDWVTINDKVSGEVEEVGLRTTTIREWSGKKVYLSNSEINLVRNYNRRDMRAIVSATFPFEEDPREIRKLLQDVCDEMVDKYRYLWLEDIHGNLVEPPQIYGVTDINTNERGGTFTVIGKTKPSTYWEAERKLRETIWLRSRERGIRLAYPRRVYELKETQ